MASKRIVFVSRSLLDPYGTGDRRRVAQIMEIMAKFGDALLVTQRDKKIDYPSITLTENNLQYAKYWAPDWWHWVEQRLKESACLACQDLSRLDDKAIYIIEDPLFFVPLIRHFTQKKIPYFIHLQNLESLITEHIADGMQQALLERELQLLSGAQGVICIAREEQWLLSQFGINAFHLPYYPVKNVVRDLMGIRFKREKFVRADRRICLITGNMGNTPTRIGYLKFLHVVQEVYPALLNDILLIGFDVKIFTSAFQSFGIQLRSNVHWDEYKTILENVRCCVCYQESGGGALCKIPEMLMAGVPVFTNTVAARSYHNLHGLYEYSTLYKLVDALRISDTIDCLPESYPSPGDALFEWLMSCI